MPLMMQESYIRYPFATSSLPTRTATNLFRSTWVSSDHFGESIHRLSANSLWKPWSGESVLITITTKCEYAAQPLYITVNSLRKFYFFACFKLLSRQQMKEFEDKIECSMSKSAFFPDQKRKYISDFYAHRIACSLSFYISFLHLKFFSGVIFFFWFVFLFYCRNH